MSKLISGYKYTTSVVINYGNRKELIKIAKKQNYMFKKQNRIERCAVYPVPGTMPNVAQLVILR